MKYSAVYAILGLVLTAGGIWVSLTQYWASTLSRIASIETSIIALEKGQDRIEQRLDSITMKRVVQFDYK